MPLQLNAKTSKDSISGKNCGDAKILLSDGVLYPIKMSYTCTGYRFTKTINKREISFVKKVQLGEQTNTVLLRNEFNPRFFDDNVFVTVGELEKSYPNGIKYGNLTPERIKEVLKEILTNRYLDLSEVRLIRDVSEIITGDEYILVGTRNHFIKEAY